MWWESCEKTHCGFWVNLDADWGTRSTLTLPTNWGLILIAFLALFIRLAGSYLWSIICFVIHQAKASPHNQDDTYHQIQLALRNTDTEASLGWKLFSVGAVHRGSRLDAFNRTYWLIALALIHAAGIGVLGGLSSRFIAGSEAVLTVKGTCGWMAEVADPMKELQDPSKAGSFNSLVLMARYGYRRSANYARSCYAQTSDNSSNACEIYTRSVLPYNVTLSDPCPFGEKVCNGSAMTFDTESLRSDVDLGINTLPENAVTLRQSMTCVPINGQRYATEWGTADELNMTASLDGSWNDNADRDEQRICYQLGTDDRNQTHNLFCLTKNALKYGGTAYDLKSSTHFVNYNGNYAPLINPNPELQIPDADVTFISLVNRISYFDKSEDPWFSAQNRSEKNNAYNVTAYGATYPRSFLACSQRYQLCNIDRSHCSPYTGVYGIPHDDTELAHVPPTQRAVFQLMWKMIWFSQLNFQLIFVGRENLIANDYLWDGGTQFGLSASLPSNHWQTEASNLFNVSLATLQRAAPTFAQPPKFDVGNPTANEDNNIVKYIVEPEDPEMRQLCESIKMRSKAHTSFTVLGLFLLIGLGLFIMLLNTIIPKAAAYWQMRTGKGAYKRLEWVESSAFQLQRMAAEGRGVGPWQGKESDVPTLVNSNDKFNLTGMSLRQKGGEGTMQGNGHGGYQVVRMGEDMEMQDHGIVRKDSSQKLLDR